MKNLINYYYNLMLNEFKRIDDKFLFEINNYKYEFLPFEYDLKQFEILYGTLIKSGKYCHEVVLNKQNMIITIYENKPYVLLKKTLYIDSDITFADILEYDIVIYENKPLNWKTLWKEKIDYYEYQISQIGVKYKFLSESMGYYIGLSETAISILNFVDQKKLKFSICHRRINYNDKVDCLFNPLNIVIDNIMRDISEFLKNQYVNGLIDLDEVFTYLERIDLDYNESLLLIARLMYPSYYFDLYDQIIQGKADEEKIKQYTKKNTHYEVFIKSVYKYLKLKYNIIEIEWLKS